jgi:hypothetical protein
MARGNNQGLSSARSEFSASEYSKLTPASNLSAEQKKTYAKKAVDEILSFSNQRVPNEGIVNDIKKGVLTDLGMKYEPDAIKMAQRLANGMVNGGERNGLQDYFPFGYSDDFVNALAKSGYAPSFKDKETLQAIGKIIDARITDSNGERHFDGEFKTTMKRQKEGFSIELYTSEYRGRDREGEKVYKESDSYKIAFIPHDEISARNAGNKGLDEDIIKSKAYLKAEGLNAYLKTLLMVTNF